MPTTTTYGISYPTGTQAPNVPLAMQATADSVEAALVAIQSSTSANVALGGLYNQYTSSGSYGAPKYTKAFNKTITTTGMIGTTGATITMTGGTQYLIATLPVGVRPPYDIILQPKTATAMGGVPTLYIRANGDVHFENSTTFTSLAKGSFWISLDNISWTAL
ncbi:hypothetical protein FV140_14640 [Paenarthrobacter ureafaciens]|uniref:Uncharacterized protein n=1 Tax=Paenarthrobacter ureafaciens TaxID=37931 RepID=A0AAX3EE99_PAEUR|nr:MULTISPECIES: hypothetical protein [Paenarthrobacter]MDO5876500.1 hypothetical protein [Paenarthrobacter sp. SD-1]QMU83197.1 hypothetical protein FV140_14640 [Paenarthrobacter ureafaciens]UYV96274.1 hypothetical protein NL394_14520 [Paenarthrobacter ureafaciens]